MIHADSFFFCMFRKAAMHFLHPVHSPLLFRLYRHMSYTPTNQENIPRNRLPPDPRQVPSAKEAFYNHPAFSSFFASLSTTRLTISTYAFLTDSCFGIVIGAHPFFRMQKNLFYKFRAFTYAQRLIWKNDPPLLSFIKPLLPSKCLLCFYIVLFTIINFSLDTTIWQCIENSCLIMDKRSFYTYDF